MTSSGCVRDDQLNSNNRPINIQLKVFKSKLIKNHFWRALNNSKRCRKEREENIDAKEVRQLLRE